MMLLIDRYMLWFLDLLPLVILLFSIILMLVLKNIMMKLGMLLVSVGSMMIVWLRFNAYWPAGIGILLYSVNIISLSCFSMIYPKEKLLPIKFNWWKLIIKGIFMKFILIGLLIWVLGDLVKDYYFTSNLVATTISAIDIFRCFIQKYHLIVLLLGIKIMNIIIVLISLYKPLNLGLALKCCNSTDIKLLEII